MKKIMLICALFIYTLGAVAQDNRVPQNPTGQPQLQGADLQNHIMMQDGRMMVVKDGKSTTLDQDMTLSNGTIVSRTGDVTIKDGKSTTLKNGDYINMDGIKIGEKGVIKDKSPTK